MLAEAQKLLDALHVLAGAADGASSGGGVSGDNGGGVDATVTALRTPKRRARLQPRMLFVCSNGANGTTGEVTMGPDASTWPSAGGLALTYCLSLGAPSSPRGGGGAAVSLQLVREDGTSGSAVPLMAAGSLTVQVLSGRVERMVPNGPFTALLLFVE